jgi:hypothetical protein
VLGYSNGREENPFVECRKQGLTYGEYTARKYAASQFSVKDSIQYAKKNGYMTYRERMRMKQEPGKN